MPRLWRAAVAAWLIAAAGMASATPPFDAAATRDAQRALFSMPAMALYGRDRATPPEGFDGEQADQDDLIAYLAAAQRRGADLNALVQLGTPLHHALRSGLDRTAQWLLAQGADPTLLTEEPDAARGGRDALELAVAYGRWAVLPALRRHPAVAALSPADRAQRIWGAAQATPGRATELLERRVPLPRFAGAQGGGLAQTVLIHGLCSGQLGLARALLDAEPSVHPAPPPAATAPLCPLSTAAAPVPRPVAVAQWVAQWAAQWVALEHRLGWPLLPDALRAVATDADARALLAAPLARPWAQPGFARRMLTEALVQRKPALLPILHAVPPAVLQTEVRSLLVEWAAVAADWPLDELQWALTQVEPAALTAAMAEVATRWDNGATLTSRRAKNAGERDERWRLLTQRLSGAPPATVSPLFLYGVPEAVWARWFALGFRVADDDWANWQLWASPDALRAAWPRVAPHHPVIAQHSLTWLVAPLSAGPIADAVATRLSYNGTLCCWNDNLDKARFLAAQGLKVAPVRPLAAAFGPQPADVVGLRRPSVLANVDDVAAALQAGWVLPPRPAKRLALAPVRCKPRLTPAMRRALATPSRSHGEAEADLADPTTLQWIDAPQGDECIYFVYNGAGGGRLFINDERFEGGVNRLTPCPDNGLQAIVWRPRAAAWVALQWPGQGGVSQVRLPDGGVGWVQHALDFGGCGSQAGRALLVQRAADGDGWQWAPAPDTDRLTQWLAQHCNLQSLSESCLSPPAPDPRGPQAAADAPAEPPLDQLLAAEKAAFLAAVDGLDRDALATALRDGVFPHWVQAAIERVSGATAMPLADKRRRMAWLLARHNALPGLNDPVLESLVAWLPTEDWAPLQRYGLCLVDGASGSRADRLAELARERGRADLEARLLAGAGRRCGS